MDTLDQQLMSGLGFDSDDLQANRENHLTERQREQLRDLNRSYQRSLLPTFGIILGIQTVGVGIALALGKTSLVELRQGGLPVVGLIAGLFLVAVVVGRIFTSDLRTGRISVVEGRCRLVQRDYGYRGTGYEVKIGRKIFYTLSTQFYAFHEGRYYRVYYIKHRLNTFL